MLAPLLPISDDEKLQAEAAIRDLLKTAADRGDIQHRPSVCHMGVLYAQQRQRGISHDAARAEIERVARAWQLAAWDVRIPDIRHIGDNEILALVAQVGVIPEADWGGLFDLGCQFGQRIEAGHSFAAAYFAAGTWLAHWYATTNPWPAPPKPQHPDPLYGPLRFDRGFCDDTGPRNVASLHLGDLIGVGLLKGVDAILPILDLAAECGYHVIRSWWQLFINPGDQWLLGPPHRKLTTHSTIHGWDPRDHRTRFVEILQAGADRGLQWHLAAGGTRGLSAWNERDLFSTLQTAVEAVGSQHIALIEGINEARDTARDATPSAIAELLAPLRAAFPHTLFALSAFTGHEDREIHRAWTPGWQPFVLQHDYRDGELHDKIRHLFSNLNPHEGPPLVRKYFWRGEPFGPGWLVSAIQHQDQLDAGAMQMAAVMAAMTRSVWTFMSGPGVALESEPIESMPGLRETPTILRALPQDLARFDILDHSHPSKPARLYTVREDARDVRADYAIDSATGRYVELTYGPPHQRHDLPRHRGRTTEVLLQHPWGNVELGQV